MRQNSTKGVFARGRPRGGLLIPAGGSAAPLGVSRRRRIAARPPDEVLVGHDNIAPLYSSAGDGVEFVNCHLVECGLAGLFHLLLLLLLRSGMIPANRQEYAEAIVVAVTGVTKMGRQSTASVDQF